MSAAGLATPPAPPSQPDIKMDIINVRLQGAREAINRSRIAFLAATIASLSIFITEWNAYISWYRRFPLRLAFPANPVTEETFKKVLQQYVESRVINISLLGIHVGVSDLAALGTLALFVFVIWLFFSVRRENHAIGTLLVDTVEAPEDLRRYVYYGVASFLIFTTSTSVDEPIATLDREKLRRMRDIPPGFASRLLRRAVESLFLLPALVSLSTIVFDLLSVYVLEAALGYPHAPLRYGGLEPHSRIQLVIMEAIALGFSVPTAYLCVKILSFEVAVSAIIRVYSEKLR